MMINMLAPRYHSFESIKSWIDAGMPISSYILGDCMDGMAAMRNKFACLSIVDPPYGIGIMNAGGYPASQNFISWERKEWDSKPPDAAYFKRLRKVSKNQIIWGGNYFADHLGTFRSAIIWDKIQRNFTNSDFELAWTSFDRANRAFSMSRVEAYTKQEKIHPAQKPIALYRWLLKNYAQPGDLILDTHVGSASSLIACEQMGFKYVGFELDAGYYRDSAARLEKARELLRQGDMFAPKTTNGKSHGEQENFSPALFSTVETGQNWKGKK